MLGSRALVACVHGAVLESQGRSRCRYPLRGALGKMRRRLFRRGVTVDDADQGRGHFEHLRERGDEGLFVERLSPHDEPRSAPKLLFAPRELAVFQCRLHLPLQGLPAARQLRCLRQGLRPKLAQLRLVRRLQGLALDLEVLQRGLFVGAQCLGGLHRGVVLPLHRGQVSRVLRFELEERRLGVLGGPDDLPLHKLRGGLHLRLMRLQLRPAQGELILRLLGIGLGICHAHPRLLGLLDAQLAHLLELLLELRFLLKLMCLFLACRLRGDAHDAGGHALGRGRGGGLGGRCGGLLFPLPQHVLLQVCLPPCCLQFELLARDGLAQSLDLAPIRPSRPQLAQPLVLRVKLLLKGPAGLEETSLLSFPYADNILESGLHAGHQPSSKALLALGGLLFRAQRVGLSLSLLDLGLQRLRILAVLWRRGAPLAAGNLLLRRDLAAQREEMLH
mmetsp:Transcript_31749/g.105176  ORF Transcript_31749/g.105176 Transcript_31749/m.105176 type:complete len:447 (-) Transcript_31749:556-1896(-)